MLQLHATEAVDTGVASSDEAGSIVGDGVGDGVGC
jgi:hypothetical protein